MSYTTSTVHRSDELEYELTITKGVSPRYYDVLIEYTGQGPEPITFTTVWNEVSGWGVVAQVNQSERQGNIGALRSYVEELQTAVEMAAEFQEVLRDL